MSRSPSWRERAYEVVREVVVLRPRPRPWSAMLRSGGAIGIGFLVFLVAGRIEAAVVCAIFTNFLCLCDRADDVVTRVWVQILGAVLSVLAGAIGALVSGSEPLILVTTFALALFAGFVHGTTPGVEAIPRYALACFVVSAFLPVAKPDTLAAVLLGTCLAVAVVVIDDRIRNGRRDQRTARIRAAMTYPGPHFSTVYGVAAVFGLAIGLVWGQSRPYWVTITTLMVMQPDRRANTVRVLQRFIGTVAGVIMAFAFVRVLPPAFREPCLLAVLLALPFLWPFGFDRNYGLGVAILSTWVLMLVDASLPATEVVAPVFLARLSDTSIGCLVALVGSFVAYEVRDDEQPEATAEADQR